MQLTVCNVDLSAKNRQENISALPYFRRYQLSQTAALAEPALAVSCTVADGCSVELQAVTRTLRLPTEDGSQG